MHAGYPRARHGWAWPAAADHFNRYLGVHKQTNNTYVQARAVNGRTPLLAAVAAAAAASGSAVNDRQRLVQLVQLLVDRGADLAAVDKVRTCVCVYVCACVRAGGRVGAVCVVGGWVGGWAGVGGCVGCVCVGGCYIHD